MKLEYQVVSLELSNILHKLGVKQDSLFYYAPTLYGNFNILYLPESHNRFYSAFTVAELGELLPKDIKIIIDIDKEGHGVFTPSLWIGRIDIECDGAYQWLLCYGDNHKIWDINESNARAKMLIYLIENGYMKNDK